MEKASNEKEMFGYDKPFRYSAEWYANTYHHDHSDDTIDSGQYETRDRECIEAMGIQDGDEVLIPGCGGGNNISLLQKMYSDLKITGFDWSSTTIANCRRAFPNCTFATAGVSDFEYTHGQFDRVLAIDFTEHLSLMDYLNFLAMSFNVLRPGGMVGILPGFTARPEHINRIYAPSIAQHLSQFGFRLIAIGKQWVVGQKS